MTSRPLTPTEAVTTSNLLFASLPPLDLTTGRIPPNANAGQAVAKSLPSTNQLLITVVSTSVNAKAWISDRSTCLSRVSVHHAPNCPPSHVGLSSACGPTLTPLSHASPSGPIALRNSEISGKLRESPHSRSSHFST